jgi:hypothetical protein
MRRRCHHNDSSEEEIYVKQLEVMTRLGREMSLGILESVFSFQLSPHRCKMLSKTLGRREKTPQLVPLVCCSLLVLSTTRGTTNKQQE